MDADKPETVTIFHLYRGGGQGLFLHPFQDPDRFLEIVEKAAIEGRYGREPQFACFTQFRRQLYRLIDRALRRWVYRYRLVPRAVAALSVLIAAYMLPSIVFHYAGAHLALLVLPVCAALLAYLVLSLTDMRSEAVTSRRRNLRAKVDSIRFEPDPLVVALEGELERNQEGPPEHVLRTFLAPSSRETAVTDEREAKAILDYLHEPLAQGGRRHRGGRTSDLQSRLWNQSASRSLAAGATREGSELSLSALYRRVLEFIRPAVGHGRK